MSGIYDDAYLRANADALRAEDDAALHAFRRCHGLTDDERDDIAAYWSTRPWITAVAHQRGHTLRFHDETPVRIVVRHDADEEPWGDPVGLGMPRPRMTPLQRIVWALTAKYRRVWG